MRVVIHAALSDAVRPLLILVRPPRCSHDRASGAAHKRPHGSRYGKVQERGHHAEQAGQSRFGGVTGDVLAILLGVAVQLLVLFFHLLVDLIQRRFQLGDLDFQVGHFRRVGRRRIVSR